MKDTIVHVHIHGLKSRGDGVCVVVRSHGERPPEVEDIVVFNYLFFMSGMNLYSILLWYIGDSRCTVQPCRVGLRSLV